MKSCKGCTEMEDGIFAAVDRIGNVLVGVFHRLALFAIGVGTVFAATMAFFGMYTQGHLSVQDLLLMFIYLELGAMVGIYFRTNHMPVRFLVYIGITALTRHMINLIAEDAHTHYIEILVLGVTTLVLAVSVFIIRYTSTKYPSDHVQ